MSIPLQDQFRVRAQLLPDASVFVEPGLLADGTQVRALGPFVLPVAGNPTAVRRSDRVVLDRGTGTVVVRSGTETPPALAPGEVALARIFVEPGAGLVLDAAIADERALWPATGASAPPLVLLRRLAKGIGTEYAWTGDTLRKVHFADAGLTVGDGFVEADSMFEARAHGYYQITCALGRIGDSARVRLNTRFGTESEAGRAFSNAFSPGNGKNAVAIVSDTVELRAGERLIVYGEPGNLAIEQDVGKADISFLTIQRVG